MRHTALTRRIAASPLASAAALPTRLTALARHNTQLMRAQATWLVRSREHVHYTYDLKPLNLEHLAWTVSAATGAPVADVRGYLAEVRDDAELRATIEAGLAASPRRATTDRVVRYGRRIGWYAFVRALRPEFVVETGTNRGLGSAVIAAALLRNGHGTLATCDLDDRSGELIRSPYDKVVEHVVADSLAFLAGPVARRHPVDLFVSDTAVSERHEEAELASITPLLAPGAVVLATMAHKWSALPKWAEEQSLAFSYFAERPEQHWYPGLGIGAAYPAKAGS
ncbi:class I SAM-dependent methyltransferase [Yinghuangia seranimata]|uniref:class I SAM-dependent methyltransferase n=1 Tax=Yinghuangia seranimata TaxID=408067 RepID=UPI00248B45F3|nr:class I SAM-dependent methyltransferase [Yinghuangia seranimata]MDI2124560.1 class I SAM-dependent methyltransferase [Yinghuangia seranimata]